VTSYGFSPVSITLGTTANATVCITGGTSGNYTLRLRRDRGWGLGDEDVDSYVVGHNETTTTSSISFTPTDTGKYHLDLGAPWTRPGGIWTQPNDASRLEVTAISVTAEFSPSSIAPGATTSATISITGGPSGNYTLRLRQDFEWGHKDKTADNSTFSHDGTTTTYGISFTPTVTGKYHLDLGAPWTLEGGLWTQPNDASRLAVTDLSVTAYGFSPSSIPLGSAAEASISITGGTAGRYTLRVINDRDETVASHWFSHDGRATTSIRSSFTPALAGNYHLGLLFDGDDVWDQRNDASRLVVHQLEWSFAVIADLHIGYGIGDYGGTTPAFPRPYADNNTGQSYEELSSIQSGSAGPIGALEGAVRTILDQADLCKIRFVVVLGDISDTAEESEFCKARDILNGLHSKGIPYIPLLGNHDTAPYTQQTDNSDDRPKPWDQPGTGNLAAKADYCGDQVFHRILWDENPVNGQLIANTFGPSWKEGLHPTQDYVTGVGNECLFVQNQAFTYGTANATVDFMCLDLAERKNPLAFPAHFPVCWPTAVEPMWEETKDFLEANLKRHTNQSLVILNHFPFGSLKGEFDGSYLANLLVDNGYDGSSAYCFAGHTHRNEDSVYDLVFDWAPWTFFCPAYHVIETEAISQVKLEALGGIIESSHTGQSIRIVQVRTDGSLDYSLTLAPSP